MNPPNALQLMDLTSLVAVIGELREELIPSKFEKAQQIEPQTLQLGFRTLKKLIWLELSWQADAPRLVQISPPEKSKTESTISKQLQYGLRQLALIEIKQETFERVIEFQFAKRPGGNLCRILVLEMMGRHSNLLLLDQHKRVITLGRQIRSHHSRVRPIGTGDRYIPPPKMKGKPPNKNLSLKEWKEDLSIKGMSFKQSLLETYQGISPALALQIAGETHQEANDLTNKLIENLSEEQWEFLYKRWSQWINCLKTEDFQICFQGPTPFRVWSQGLNSSNPRGKACILLGEYYREHLNRKSILELNRSIRKKLDFLNKKKVREIKQQEDLLKDSKNSYSLKEKADEIFSRQFPSKEDIMKAQNLYKRVKRLRRSVETIEERIEYHKQQLDLVKGSEIFLDIVMNSRPENSLDQIQNLKEIEKEVANLIREGSSGKDRSSQKGGKTPKPLEIQSPRGLIVQVGRNHRQNDWISIRKSKHGDIWFHAQECPGSHVVLKASSRLAEQEDIQLAANLAANFSRARGNRLVPVVMTSTDNLKRIPGAQAGIVQHQGGKVLWGNPSKAREYILQVTSNL